MKGNNLKKKNQTNDDYKKARPKKSFRNTKNYFNVA